MKNYFCIIKEEQAFPTGRKKYYGGFAMKEKNLLKVCEILAGRVLELENELTVSQYRIDKLREIVEKAEREAEK